MHTMKPEPFRFSSIENRMLLDLSTGTVPLSPDRLFGRAGPLVMEIGFGDGWFLAHLAKTQPSWNLLGAEVSIGSVTRAFKRMRRERIANVRLYPGQACFVLRTLLAPHTLHRIYVNFPDPWPKKRHHVRRLLRAPFFRLVSTRLAEGGALLFTTDHADYFTFALDEARSTGLFSIEQRSPPEAMLQTKYARKWRAQNLSIQHAAFIKTAEAETSFPPAVENQDAMHHAFLDGALPQPDAFERYIHRFDGGCVILLEALHPVGEDALIFMTRIEEEDLTQDVLVEAGPSRKSPDAVLVSLKTFGQPLATPGTREAVRAVTEWLEQHGMRMTDRFF